MVNSDVEIADIYPEISDNEVESSLVIGGWSDSYSNSNSDDSSIIDSEAE
jgi:hypothetical protein